MAPIFEEIVITWDGEDYTVQPSFHMVQKIESRGISIFGVCMRMKSSQLPVSQVSEIVSFMLESGGVKVTPEEVYARLVTNFDLLCSVCETIVRGFIPQEEPSGNSEAPQKGGAKAKKKKPKTSSG